MEIIEKCAVYCHTPGFRRFGRVWRNGPVAIGVVEKLPEEDLRSHEDVDFLVTKAEFKTLERLNEEDAYPLRIIVADIDPTERLLRQGKQELDRIQEAIQEARVQREEIESELKTATGQLESLRTGLAELNDAVEAAEKRAREKEAEADRLQEQVEGLQKQSKQTKKGNPKG